eukprot:CAMPEP_0171843884 /NCGR_PEP_ID=MMETSP0992-20121227/16138_1 /TAXON_ID=483369 /ORGANISM="non described non described, Strain CCMP2098" /LENGTH=710 /DNA_ID=CAMNT_0012461571 /DNA_START=72 /DNA_END=2201 /DNA_ORIENTATION=+
MGNGVGLMDSQREELLALSYKERVAYLESHGQLTPREAAQVAEQLERPTALASESSVGAAVGIDTEAIKRSPGAGDKAQETDFSMVNVQSISEQVKFSQNSDEQLNDTVSSLGDSRSNSFVATSGFNSLRSSLRNSGSSGATPSSGVPTQNSSIPGDTHNYGGNWSCYSDATGGVDLSDQEVTRRGLDKRKQHPSPGEIVAALESDDLSSKASSCQSKSESKASHEKQKAAERAAAAALSAEGEAAAAAMEEEVSTVVEDNAASSAGVAAEKEPEQSRQHGSVAGDSLRADSWEPIRSSRKGGEEEESEEKQGGGGEEKDSPGGKGVVSVERPTAKPPRSDRMAYFGAGISKAFSFARESGSAERKRPSVRDQPSTPQPLESPSEAKKAGGGEEEKESEGEEKKVDERKAGGGDAKRTSEEDRQQDKLSNGRPPRLGTVESGSLPEAEKVGGEGPVLGGVLDGVHEDGLQGGGLESEARRMSDLEESEARRMSDLEERRRSSSKSRASMESLPSAASPSANASMESLRNAATRNGHYATQSPNGTTTATSSVSTALSLNSGNGGGNGSHNGSGYGGTGHQPQRRHSTHSHHGGHSRRHSGTNGGHGANSSRRASVMIAKVSYPVPGGWRISEKRELGSGSFGRVFLGLNTRTGELLAVKRMAIPTDQIENDALDQMEQQQLEELDSSIKEVVDESEGGAGERGAGGGGAG